MKSANPFPFSDDNKALSHLELLSAPSFWQKDRQRFRWTVGSPAPIATAPAAMAAVRSAPAQAAGNLPETGLNRC